MKNLFLIPLIMVAILFSCKSDDSEPGPVPDDVTPVSATYRITFMPDFTEDNFPDDYPTNATFSGIFVAVHAPTEDVFNVGTPATPGLKALAEDGANATLNNELSTQGDGDSNDFNVFNLSASGGPTEQQSIEIVIDPEKTSVTFLTSLSPSPDWFLGVDSFSLIASSNTLVEMEEVQVLAYDAGTDSGTTYESPDEPSNPVGQVRVIDTPPLVQDIGIGGSIGKILIERTDN